jgi:RNase P subunit RPR2
VVVFGYACSTQGCIEGFLNPNQINMMCENCGSHFIKESQEEIDRPCTSCGQNNWINLLRELERSSYSSLLSTHTVKMIVGPNFEILNPEDSKLVRENKQLMCPHCKTGSLSLIK